MPEEVKQFVLTGYDYTDDQALERRMATREAHFACISELQKEGKALMAGAMLNDDGKMIGSIIFFQMTQAQMDEYLETEPYIAQKVWEKIDLREVKIPPIFLN